MKGLVLLAVACGIPVASSLRAQIDDALAEAIVEQGGEQNSRVMDWQDYLCNHIGPRLTGSDGFTVACDWARGEFEKLGLEARLEPWAEWKVVWNRGQWMGRMIEPEALELQVATPAWTAGTRGVVRGRLVGIPKNARELTKLGKLLDDGETVWLWAPSLRQRDGEVMTTIREWLDGGRFAGRVQSAKSTGRTDERFENQIRVFGERTAPLRSYASRSRLVHVIVRDDQAAVLEKRLKGRKKVVVEFEIRNRFRDGPIELNNVIADLKGTEKPDEMVIVCAHLDSWHQATGATDNGTGVSTTMEAARILTAVGAEPRRTIRFILWGGEEQGLLGSNRYVTMHRREMHRVSGVFNHDSGTNWAHRLTVTETMFPLLRKAMAPVFTLSAPNPKHRGPTFVLDKTEIMKPAGGGSDHASFAKVGVPAWPWGLEGERPYGYGWHSQWDTYTIVEPAYQRHTATVVALTALAVANLDELLPRDGVERRDPRSKGDASLVVEAVLGVELDALKFAAVDDGGVAARAGVKSGDVLTGMWGESVRSPVDAARWLREKRDETEWVLRVDRGGTESTLRAPRSK